MNSLATSFVGPALALFLAATSVGPVAAQEGDSCLTARQAQQAVESGEILELPDAARRAGVKQKYIDNQAQLCDVDGSPHWIVNMMNESGDSTRVVLNASGD